MGCFLGCFGGEKDHKRGKRNRVKNLASPEYRRKRVLNVQQQSVTSAGQSASETAPINLVSESRNKTEGEEKLKVIPSPRKKVTFDSNVTTYEHVSLYDSTDSLLEQCEANQTGKKDGLRSSTDSRSPSEDDSSVISSVGSYPPNHRYHNARNSDDEAEEYGDSDMDDLDDFDDEDDLDDHDEDIDDTIAGREVWSESVLTGSMESRTENHSAQAINGEIESPLLRYVEQEKEVAAFVPPTYARDRSGYVNLVLNPVENISQWKAIKSRRTQPLKPQKENINGSFSSWEPVFKQSCGLKPKSDQSKNEQEIAVNASLSSWLVSTPEKSSISQGSNSAMSFEDRPILGALTVDELKQISSTSSSKKSPSRSPDEMPIIGTVGSYWHNAGSAKHSDSAAYYEGIPNETSKYTDDKIVNWHATSFETRLERALNQGAAEA